MGARFIGMRNGSETRAPTPPGTRLELEVAREIGEVARDVGLESGEQVVEGEQDEPVLVLPPLVFGACRSRCAGDRRARDGS